MSNWIKRKLRKYLGIDDQEQSIIKLNKLTSDLVSIGVDVHFKEPHMILIYSRLNGGQIREISATFDNVKELNDFVKELKDRYNTKMETWDLPQGMKHYRNYF